MSHFLEFDDLPDRKLKVQVPIKEREREERRREGKRRVPWHSLDETFAKMVISNGDLHLLVSYIRITMTQEHHLK